VTQVVAGFSYRNPVAWKMAVRGVRLLAISHGTGLSLAGIEAGCLMGLATCTIVQPFWP